MGKMNYFTAEEQLQYMGLRPGPSPESLCSKGHWRRLINPQQASTSLLHPPQWSCPPPPWSTLAVHCALVVS